MNERVEAAAQAIAVYSDCDQWESEATKASAALAAADAVMFSDESIERAAKVLRERDQEPGGITGPGGYTGDVLAVIAALKGSGDE